MTIKFSKSGTVDTIVTADGYAWSTRPSDCAAVVSITQDGKTINIHTKDMDVFKAVLDRAAVEATKQVDRSVAWIAKEANNGTRKD